MKENVIDVLLYLFENYIDTEESQQTSKDGLELELEQVGFQEQEIYKALDWLENITVVADEPVTKNASVRLFSSTELEKLDVTCRGYLLFLEQVGVLDENTREVVIDRVMALDADEIDLEQLKWIVLMVLFYQPGREVAFAWMEDLVFDDVEAVIH